MPAVRRATRVTQNSDAACGWAATGMFTEHRCLVSGQVLVGGLDWQMRWTEVTGKPLPRRHHVILQQHFQGISPAESCMH
jgi:hypothetical protein